MQSAFNKEIKKSIMNANAASGFGDKTDRNPIEYLNDIIVKMSTVIMCK